ncbi:MAG: ABC transporter permease [Promethearchaeota archaeon]
MQKVNQYWALIVKFLKITFREKENWFWIFGYPLLFMVLFSVAFNSSSSRTNYNIAIINNDTSGLVAPATDMGANVSLTLLSMFDENNSLSESFQNHATFDNGSQLTEQSALKLVNEEKLDAVIIIPENFSEVIIGSTWWYSFAKQGIILPNMSGSFTNLIISLNQTNYPAGNPNIEIHTIADTVTGVVISNVFKGIINNLILSYNNLTTLDIQLDVGPKDRSLSWFDMAAPGIVAVAVLVGISSIGTMFAFERSHGLLRRLDTTPVSRSTILLSGGAAQFIFSAIQVSILLACLPLFGVQIASGANWFLAFVIVMALSLTCIGIGLILAGITRSEKAAGGIAWIFILPLQFLGGAFFPMEGLIPSLVPTSYAVNAIRLVLIYGIGWTSVWQDILIVLGFGAVFSIIGLIIFSKKSQI